MDFQILNGIFTYGWLIFMVNDGKRMQKYHTLVLWVGWNLLDGSVKCTHKYSVVKCRFLPTKRGN